MAKALAILPESVMEHAMANAMVKMRQRELGNEHGCQKGLAVDITKGSKSKGYGDTMFDAGDELPTPTATERNDDRRYVYVDSGWLHSTHLSPLHFAS